MNSINDVEKWLNAYIGQVDSFHWAYFIVPKDKEARYAKDNSEKTGFSQAQRDEFISMLKRIKNGLQPDEKIHLKVMLYIIRSGAPVSPDYDSEFIIS